MKKHASHTASPQTLLQLCAMQAICSTSGSGASFAKPCTLPGRSRSAVVPVTAMMRCVAHPARPHEALGVDTLSRSWVRQRGSGSARDRGLVAGGAAAAAGSAPQWACVRGFETDSLLPAHRYFGRLGSKFSTNYSSKVDWRLVRSSAPGTTLEAPRDASIAGEEQPRCAAGPAITHRHADLRALEPY